MKRFENKIVLVTGAGRGIGASIAKRFASEGAEVIVNYSGNDEAAQKTVDEITATGGQAQKYKCSVNDSESVKVMIDEIIKEFGRIDILVNNAGITKDGLMLRMTDEDFDRVIDVNLKGTFNCTKYFFCGGTFRKCWTGKLQCLKGWNYWYYEISGKRTFKQGNYCKCSCTRIC